MLSNINKPVYSIGDVVVAYFNKISELKNTKARIEEVNEDNTNTCNSDKKFTKSKEIIERETIHYFNLLKSTAKNLIYKVRNDYNLSKVITQDQIETSILALLRQITTEPAKYEVLIEELKSKIKKNSLAKNKRLLALKAEQNVSSVIRSIFLLEENPEKKIYSYLCKTAFTILKNNAEGLSKAYLLLNNNVKRSLKELAAEKIIFEPKEKCYSINPKSVTIFNPKFRDLNTSQELASETGKLKQNLKRIIIALLRANPEFIFSPKDISSYIASIRFEEKSSTKVIKNYSEEGDDDENPSENHVVDEKAFESNLTALESMQHLIKFQGSSNVVKQKEMALLAYLYRAVSGKYFIENILTDKQMQLEETDCIENFLNDKRFSNFNKSKPVGRTTAYNRKTEALIALRNVLTDLSAEAQSVFIKKYSAYLEDRYRYYIGENR